jgi:hypothetical protein
MNNGGKMRSAIIGNELYIAKKVENINSYDIKLLKLFKNDTIEGYIEVPVSTIVKEMNTNNVFVKQIIQNTNNKIEKYGMQIKLKKYSNNIYVLEEE